MKFGEVIGQEDAKQRFRQMVREKRVPQGIMLCGKQGVGKMALAMAFAAYLLCEHHDEQDDACETCRQCAMLRKWEHPDLHFTYPTIKQPASSSEHQPTSDEYAREWHAMICKSTYFTLEDWMEQMNGTNQQAIITGAESDELAKKLSMKSSQGGYKVSIIWLPERMNPTSANKLLKLLEEPPQHTVFIMVSEAPEKLLDTIRSRVQRIDIKQIATEEIEKALVERRGLEPDTAHNIARVAGGSWNKAVSELDTGNENRMFLDMFIMLMRLAYMRNIHDLKKWSDAVGEFGREKQKRMLVYFMHMIRENFMFNFKQPELCYMTQEEANFSKNFARYVNEANVLGICALLERALRDISQNANGKIVFFDMALKMIMFLIQK